MLRLVVRQPGQIQLPAHPDKPRAVTQRSNQSEGLLLSSERGEKHTSGNKQQQSEQNMTVKKGNSALYIISGEK